MRPTSMQPILLSGAGASTAKATRSSCPKPGAARSGLRTFSMLSASTRGLGFALRIEDEIGAKGDLAASYHLLATLAPMLLEHQGAGDVHGFVARQNPSLGRFHHQRLYPPCQRDEIFRRPAQDGYGLIMATGPDEFLGAGKGFRVSFMSRTADGPR